MRTTILLLLLFFTYDVHAQSERQAPDPCPCLDKKAKCKYISSGDYIQKIPCKGRAYFYHTREKSRDNRGTYLSLLDSALTLSEEAHVTWDKGGNVQIFDPATRFFYTCDFRANRLVFASERYLPTHGDNTERPEGP